VSVDRDIRADLEPGAADELILLAERLKGQRPVPSAEFRGALRRRLLGGEALHPRPARLRMLVTGYAAAGSLLLLCGAVSAAGVGPLAA
jgi:hypothetical protein